MREFYDVAVLFAFQAVEYFETLLVEFAFVVVEKDHAGALGEVVLVLQEIFERIGVVLTVGQEFGAGLKSDAVYLLYIGDIDEGIGKGDGKAKEVYVLRFLLGLRGGAKKKS